MINTRRKILQFMGATALTAAGLAGATTEALAADVTLRLHHFLPAQAAVPKNTLQPWMKKIQEESDGRIAFQEFPAMQVNLQFASQVRDAGIDPKAQIFLLCRSGARSAAAASALTAAGFENCYNVAEGFEGDKDTDGHRGTIGGWKAAGLPWVQG